MLRANAPAITRYDYADMPQGPPYYQVVEGDLVMSPAPETAHQRIVLNIAYLLRKYLEKRRVGELFIAPLDVFLSEINVYQPDLIFVSNSRRAIITERGIEGAPDLVVEALSPGTARLDKGSKRKIYARTGVEEFWLADPATRTLQVYALQRDAETASATYGANAVFKSACFPTLRIQTKLIFRTGPEKKLA